MPRLLNSAPRAWWAYHSAPALRRGDDSGQSLIELALVFPMFFALMIGFINVCMVMFGLCNLSYACRQAGRYACLHSSTSLLPVSQSTIDAQVAPFVFSFPSNTYSDKLSYLGSGSLSGNVVGGTASVKVTITYNLVLPFITIPAITLSSTASGTIIQ